ncbi:MAG: polysaccharide biosynthesis tyrosine autokinase [Acidobacteria bacterium]|nr:polysaccharide biosynthesis tyrosine autokinase [Acidobacteriota bacterium]
MPLPVPLPVAVRHPAFEVSGTAHNPVADSDDMLGIFHKSWRMLLLIMLAGALAGLFWSSLQAPLYRAEAYLEVLDRDESFLGVRGVSPTNAGGPAASRSGLATHGQMLQGRSLNEKVLERLGVPETDSAQAARRPLAAWISGLFERPDWETGPNDQLRLASRSLEVSIPAETYILELQSDSTDPKQAALYLNTLAEVYIEENVRTRWESVQEAERWLDRQLADLQVKLEQSQEKLQQYARQSGLLFVAPRESVAEQRLAKLQQELSLAEADRIGKQSFFELARDGGSSVLPESAEVLNLRSYERELTSLRRELAELDVVYTPEHPRVKRVAAQIGEMEGAIDREQVSLFNRVNNEYQTSLRRQDLLAAQYDRQSLLVSEHAVRSIRYDILQREVNTNQDLYDSLLRRVKETGVASALSASNVRILDRAQPAGIPIGPNHAAHTAMGAMLGAFLGLLVSLVRIRTDRKLRTPADVSQWLRSPQLGAIPGVKRIGPWRSGKVGRSVRLRVRYTRNGHGSLALRSSNSPAVAPAADMRVERLAETADFSPLAESFRGALASLLFGPQGKPPVILAVTSPSPLEGKTTVASNLAISLARIGKKTLLIDADLRRPRAHEIFDLDNDLGLTSLLADAEGRHMPDIAKTIHATSIPGLSVMPSGPSEAVTAHGMFSKHLPFLLDVLRRQYAVILIDTPPVLHVADSRVVAQLADATVLVVRAGQTSRVVAHAAEQRLASDGAHLLGVVLNGWEPSAEDARAYTYETQRAPVAEGSLAATASG